MREIWDERARDALAVCPELVPFSSRISRIFDEAEHSEWPQLQRIHGDFHLGQVLRVPSLSVSAQEPGRFSEENTPSATIATHDATTHKGEAQARRATVVENPSPYENSDTGEAHGNSCPANTYRTEPGATHWVVIDFEGEPLRSLSQRRRPDLALRDVAGMIRSFDYAAGYAIREGLDERSAHSWRSAAISAFYRGYGAIPQQFLSLYRALIIDKVLYEITYEAKMRPDWLFIPLAGALFLLE